MSCGQQEDRGPMFKPGEQDRPILFNGEMVRAILEGRKTQTRRVMNPQPFVQDRNIPGLTSGCHSYIIGVPRKMQGWYNIPEDVAKPGVCPHGQPGDRLWVRETWGCDNWNRVKEYKEHPYIGPPNLSDAQVHWKAHERDISIFPKGYWRPSIHMPRWASRITLEITNVRVERVQGISPDDACAEGIKCNDPNDPTQVIMDFGALWDSINAERGFGWEANPWVWIIEFKKL